jgi:segregation and condensation protein B
VNWKRILEDTISETASLDASAEMEREAIAAEQHQSSEDLSIEMRIEALLFVSSAPVTVGQIATALEIPTRKVSKILEGLRQSLQSRGIRIQKYGSEFQLTTAPELSADIERFLTLEETSTLSRAALEALAIIAYQQPVTRPQIDSIRGVNSDSVLRTLLRYGLIEETGRSVSPGRPILYATTSEFLQYFGLVALEELPPLDPDQISDLKDTDEDLSANPSE